MLRQHTSAPLTALNAVLAGCLLHLRVAVCLQALPASFTMDYQKRISSMHSKLCLLQFPDSATSAAGLRVRLPCAGYCSSWMQGADKVVAQVIVLTANITEDECFNTQKTQALSYMDFPFKVRAAVDLSCRVMYCHLH